jgi:succinyl-diaminopimelate desuccinylase
MGSRVSDEGAILGTALARSTLSGQLHPRLFLDRRKKAQRNVASGRRSVPLDSIIALVQALVRTASRAVEDDLAPVVRCIGDWFATHGIRHRVLQADSGAPLGVYAEVQGGRGSGRPWTVLDATLDTAGFGALDSWRHAPTSAVVEDGWLHGRGSADSKAGVALFAHLLRDVAAAPAALAGRIGVLFDCDEHSGRFGGARAFFDRPFDGDSGSPRPDGVVIGYPGMDRIVTGCRGFVRARLRVHGVAAHSGAAQERGVNAVSRAADLCQALQSLPLPAPSPVFPLSPQLTVTGIRGGGEGFSQVPDACELRIDVRLTPDFDDAAARAAVARMLRSFDASRGAARATGIEWIAGWPAYQVPLEHPLVAAMQQAARQELGADVATAIVGPSNIGNYLASLGVPALCGFGVVAEGVHAANERIALDSLAPVYRIYRDALRRRHSG